MANTLLLMSDEHNPFYTSLHGHPTVQTPNMESLAQSGTWYENTYCPSPLCLPCRSSFMSGKWVHEVQAYNNSNVNLPPDLPSWGSVLAQQNIHTAFVGKVDVYNQPQNLGFCDMMVPGSRKLPGDTHQRRNPMAIRRGGADRANGYGTRDIAGSNDLKVVEQAIDWLNNTAPNLDTPWVLAVNISNPHFPHFVTQDLWDMYPDGGDLPALGLECESAQHPYAQNLRDHFEVEQFGEEQIRGLRRGYLGCVTFVDRQIGRLLETLEQNNLRDDTNFIYTSDHGEMLGKFGMWWKCSLYEHSVRVPCIASGPDFQSDQTVTTPISLLDVQATLFRSAQAERPGDWQGTPLQDIPSNDPQRPVFAEYHGHGNTASTYMIRKGQWKYIYYADGPDQLFDLDNDPEELNNIIDANPTIASDLSTDLHSICDPQVENDRAEAFINAQLETINQHPDWAEGTNG